MIHFYDPDAQEWRAIENPTASDIAEVLIAAANNRPCPGCDAEVEYDFSGGGPPVIVITHEDGCAA